MDPEFDVWLRSPDGKREVRERITASSWGDAYEQGMVTGRNLHRNFGWPDMIVFRIEDPEPFA